MTAVTKAAPPPKHLRKMIWCNPGWYPISFGFCPTAFAWDHLMRVLRMVEPCPYPDSPGAVTTFSTAHMGRCFIVTILPAPDRTPTEMIGLLVHEAAHVWQGIRRHIGEDHPGDEIEAYSLQSITQSLIWAWDESRGASGRDDWREEGMEP